MLGKVGQDIANSHPVSIAQVMKSSDPGATVVAVSSEKVYAADAMGAGASDYVLYHRYVRNGLEAAGLPGQVPPPEFFARPGLNFEFPLRSFTDWDDLSTELALAAFRHYQPEALMINLPGADIYGHKYGGAATPQVLSRVVKGLDDNVSRIVSAYREAGIEDRTIFVVTADHGMISNHRAVGPAQVRAAVERAGARYLFHTGGTAKYVYLRDEDLARAPAVAAEMRKLPGVVAAYSRSRAGQYESAGPAIDRDLDAAFRYMLHTFSGPTAPDVVAPYREHTIGTEIPHAYGNHGGFSWGVQAVPLLLAGPGVRRGVRSSAPARLVDVAPTVLRLMELPNGHTDGMVLADALQSPTLDEVADQAAASVDLRRHREALRERAEAELREDRREGIGTPPPSAFQP
jgi:hypothetical protein